MQAVEHMNNEKRKIQKVSIIQVNYQDTSLQSQKKKKKYRGSLLGSAMQIGRKTDMIDKKDKLCMAFE